MRWLEGKQSGRGIYFCPVVLSPLKVIFLKPDQRAAEETDSPLEAGALARFFFHPVLCLCKGLDRQLCQLVGACCQQSKGIRAAASFELTGVVSACARAVM